MPEERVVGIDLGTTNSLVAFLGPEGKPQVIPGEDGSNLVPSLVTNKYPASLLFLLMTLGPVLLILPFLETAGGRVAGVLTTFGRVPFFYYVLHIPLIHLAAIAVSLIRSGSVSPWLFLNHPVMIPPAPEGYVWSLGLLYLVFAIVVAVLYLPCRWFAGLKQRRKDIGFLSYL